MAEQPEEASERATERATALAVQSGREVARLWRSRREWWGHSPVERRLHTDLAVLTGDLAAASSRKADDAALTTAMGLGEAAHQALRANDPADARALLCAARRHLLEVGDRRALVDQGRELVAAGQGDDDLVEVVDHAVEAPNSRLDPLRSAVVTARRTVDDLVVAEARRQQLRAREVVLLGVVAVVLLALALVFVTVGNAPADEGEALRNLDNLNSVLGWGVFGALVSRFVPWGHRPSPPAVDYVHPVTMVVVRLVLGAVAALTVVAVLQADVQSVITITEAEAYPFALAAGFAERLLDRRLDV